MLQKYKQETYSVGANNSNAVLQVSRQVCTIQGATLGIFKVKIKILSHPIPDDNSESPNT